MFAAGERLEEYSMGHLSPADVGRVEEHWLMSGMPGRWIESRRACQSNQWLKDHWTCLGRSSDLPGPS